MAVSVDPSFYGPAPYVFENGGPLFFKWDTVYDTTPPDEFTWQIDLMMFDGSVWQTIGPQTVATTGASTNVSIDWNPPSRPPQGGVRPRWTITWDPPMGVVAMLSESYSVEHCNGITPVTPAPPPKPPCK